MTKTKYHGHLAIIFWFLSWGLALFGGVLFSIFENISWDRGIYWALTTVTTVGYGDITPVNIPGYIIADCTMVLTIPIWSLAIAFATSWFTSWHIWESHDQTKQHLADPEQTIELGNDFWVKMHEVIQAVVSK